MKKFVLLYIYIFLMLPVFAQTNFQELGLEKALEKAKDQDLRCQGRKGCSLGRAER